MSDTTQIQISKITEKPNPDLLFWHIHIRAKLKCPTVYGGKTNFNFRLGLELYTVLLIRSQIFRITFMEG